MSPLDLPVRARPALAATLAREAGSRRPKSVATWMAGVAPNWFAAVMGTGILATCATRCWPTSPAPPR